MLKTYEEIFSGEYSVLPEATKEALWAWVQHGQPGGDFLDALVTNDLMGVFAHADDSNLPHIRCIVRWLFNRAPAGCYSKSKSAVPCWRGLETLLAPTVTLQYLDDDGNDAEATFPAKSIPCPRCPDGTVDCFEGRVTDDMREDPDFAEDYKAGKYSKPCPECNGTRKILEPDEAKMTDEQKRLYEEVQDYERFDAQCRAAERQERRMGC
jgi:hypothetical protein